MNGLEVVFDMPAPDLRPWGLATETYRSLESILPADPNGVPYRWLNGVKWLPYGCSDTTAKRLDNECISTAQSFVTPEAFQSVVTMDAFRIESSFACSSIGGLGVNGEDVYKHALEVTRQDRSRQLARQVMFGTPETTNIDLVDQATGADIVSTSDTTPFGALAAVEDALASRLNNAIGMIHISPGMLTYLASGGGMQLLNGEWRTPSGHIVVADAGYVGAGGLAGQNWIYGSGIVYYASTPLKPLGESWQSIDWETERDNNVIARVEQYMIAVFEPCPVVTARSDIIISPIGI